MLSIQVLLGLTLLCRLELVIKPRTLTDGAISVSKFSDAINFSASDNTLKSVEWRRVVVFCREAYRCYTIRDAIFKLTLKAAHVADMQSFFKEEESLLMAVAELLELLRLYIIGGSLMLLLTSVLTGNNFAQAHFFTCG